MDRLVDGWLAAGGQRQVVVLGAGSDSRFWRVMVSFLFPVSRSRATCGMASDREGIGVVE